MADRVVSVTIRAEVANFLAGAEKVRKATAETATEAQKLEKQSAAFEKVGASITTIGLAATAAVAIAVKSFADFDAQMSQVQSLSHATAAEMDQLRNAALTMGQGIGFSATEVADAETELVKAGVSVKDIMGGALKGALDLAAAGQIEVGRATEIAATALTQFGLKGKDVPHVADLLAAAADKSLGGVEQLGQALQQSGLVANQFGLTIDETVGTLAEFASNGLLSSDAGTSLKQMFLQLATPTKQASDAMQQYGIQAYDASGKFVGITALAGQLADGFHDVDDASRDSALGIIFGSDAIRAANILMTDGADGNRKWVNSVNEAGFAAQQAAGKTDNLNGDVKKLGAAFESGLIKSGSASNDVLRTMVQNVTGLVSAVSSAPPALLGVGLGLTALVGATALAGGGFLQLVPKIAAAKAAMADLNMSGKTLAKGFAGGAGIALGLYAITAGIAGLGSEAQLTESQIAKLNNAMTQTAAKSLNSQFNGGGVNATQGIISQRFAQVDSARKALELLSSDSGKWQVGFAKAIDGIFQTGAADTPKRFAAQFKQMGTTLAGTAQSDVASAAQGFNQLVKQMGGGQDTARELLNQLDPYKAQLIELAGAQGKTLSEQELLNLAQGKGSLAASLAAQSTQQQNDALADLSGVASQADQDISALADSIRSFGSTQLDVESTESDFQAAIDAASAALQENGKTLDLNSEKGRDNAAALRQIASDGVAATAAIAENGGTQEQAAAKMQSVRDAYIQAAQALGMTPEAAAAAADGLKLIPSNVTTLFQTQGAGQVEQDAAAVQAAADAATRQRILRVQGDVKDAQDKLDATKAKLDRVPASKRTEVRAEVEQANANLLSVLRTLNQLQSKTLTVTTINRAVTESVAAGAAPGAAKAAYAKATGGFISGPGTGTSDDIPAMLSNGEYVIRAASVQKYGRHTFDRMNAGHYANGGLVQRFANGGGVQYAYSKAAGSYTGLQGVSQLMSMYGDNDLSIRLRNQSGMAALQFQRSLTKLTDQSEAASSKLSDLKSSASSLATSVTSAVSKFDVGGYRSASQLSRGLSKSAGQVKEFAGLLTALSKKGINGDLLAEIASLGTAEGLPLARSLAAASAAEVKSINASYKSIQTTAAAAGKTVADANYKALISSADKNARSLERQIANQSAAIQRIIARGFGVKGYAGGGYTGDGGVNEVAGVVHGREYVMTAAATARNRPALEAMNAGRPLQYMQPTRVVQTQAAAAPVSHREVHNHIAVQDPTAVAQAIERRERAEYA